MVHLIMFGTPFNDVFEIYYNGIVFECTERLIMSVC